MVRAAEDRSYLTVDFASQAAPLPDPDTFFLCRPVPPVIFELLNLELGISADLLHSDTEGLHSDTEGSGSSPPDLSRVMPGALSATWESHYGFNFLWDGRNFERYDLTGFNADFIGRLPDGLTHYRAIVISESGTEGLEKFVVHIFANVENGGVTYHGSVDFTSLVADYNQGMSHEDAAKRAMDEFARFLSECKE